MSSAHLHLEGYSTDLFNDGSYRWFHETEYRICTLADDTTDQELLENLIRQPSFSTMHFTPSPRAHPLQELRDAVQRDRVHGPYRLPCVTVERFEQVDAAAMNGRLMDWGHLYDQSVPPKALREIERLGHLAAAATSVFWLGALEDDCVVEWNYFGAWEELVIVDRRSDELLLVAVSSD